MLVVAIYPFIIHMEDSPHLLKDSWIEQQPQSQTVPQIVETQSKEKPKLWLGIAGVVLIVISQIILWGIGPKTPNLAVAVYLILVVSIIFIIGILFIFVNYSRNIVRSKDWIKRYSWAAGVFSWLFGFVQLMSSNFFNLLLWVICLIPIVSMIIKTIMKKEEND